MKVKELIAHLEKFDPELSVIVDRHSDYHDIAAPSVFEAVRRKGYVEHYFRYQYTSEKPPDTEQFVYIGSE